MGYRTLQSALHDLERTGQLIRIPDEIDPYLEAAEIQRRVVAAHGPAILMERVKGCRFPMVCNLFGTIERTRFLFRDKLQAMRRLLELKTDPATAMRQPWKTAKVLPTAWAMRPKFVSTGPCLENRTTIDQLPQMVSWPLDGGPFITLPAVYTEHPHQPGWQHSNLGMYRVQLAGNQYDLNREVGLHYQIHRGIGIHHTAARERGEPLKVNIFIGGPPALILAAVMPLPEGLSELIFAGALGGRRVKMIRRPEGLPIAAEADFCITGYVDPNQLKPEGPFGDHLGYYSLKHPFPVLKVEQVFHRNNAIWPFTVVGRPPQEDTAFGQMIHEITGPAIPSLLPGVKAIHAVDAAGVHPLLLAIGSERYVPFADERHPQELLTQANAILGQGQLSLAKYLFIVAEQDNPRLDVHDIPGLLRHLLERVDWTRDLHFQTRTTIDTLDYTGDGLNAGSKLVVAAAGPKRRELPDEIPPALELPDGCRDARVVLPGVMAISAPPVEGIRSAEEILRPGEPQADGHPGPVLRSDGVLRRFCQALGRTHLINHFPLIVLCDDSSFATASLENFLWVTFTRSNPAADIDGVDSFIDEKHFGCRGSLVIDARIKPHHAPPLREDPEVVKRVEALAAPGGPLHGVF